MAARVVLDVPAAGGAARLGRGLAVLLGSLLMLIGMLSLPFALLAAAALGNSFVAGVPLDEGSPPAGIIEVLVSFGALAAVAILIWFGLWLVRGRRRLALYLRKFGYGDSTRAVTRALTSAVGTRLRVVTLDDAVVAPVGVARTGRRVAAFIFVVFTGLIAWALYWLFGGGFDRLLIDTQQALEDTRPETDDPFERFGNVIGTGIAAFAVSIVVLSLIFTGLLLALGVVILAASAYVSALIAGRYAKRSIGSDQAIAPTARRIARISRRVFSPRLFVMRVTDAIWPQAVRGLGAAADVVIIDVSHPTDALLWEVEAMRLIFGRRWLLVGAYEYVTPLANPQTANSDDHRGRLARLLDGEQVIAYGHTKEDIRRFSRALRHRLHAVRT
jgi:hypothetical protein